jgi:ubiquitin C-terminal hydrolase
LPISERERPSTLIDCLRAFTNTEAVSDVSCDRCGRSGRAGKRLTVVKAPTILCIHLARLVTTAIGRNVKLNCPIDFDEHLDLAPFVRSIAAPRTSHVAAVAPRNPTCRT